MGGGPIIPNVGDEPTLFDVTVCQKVAEMADNLWNQEEIINWNDRCVKLHPARILIFLFLDSQTLPID